MKNSCFLAFMGGALIAATAAILFAPEKGEVTRRRIKNKVKNEQDKMMDSIKNKYDAVKHKYDLITNKIEEEVCGCDEI